MQMKLVVIRNDITQPLKREKAVLNASNPFNKF